MSIDFSPQAVNRDPLHLCPRFLAMVNAAINDCHAKNLPVEIFEGWRSPQRQAWLYAKGRYGSKEKVVTNAQEWGSWHQFGLAVDVVFKDKKGQWTWNGDYDAVEKIFLAHGLEKGPRFEHAHFELTGGVNILIAKGVMQNIGLQRVWAEACANLPAQALA